MSSGLSGALSDHDLVSFLDHLYTVLELEPDAALVVGSHLRVVHLDSLHSLAHAADVQNCLISVLDGCVMMEYFDVGVEVFDALGMVWVHTFVFHRYRVDEA